MDAPAITALAALLGAATGRLTSVLATWLTHQVILLADLMSVLCLVSLGFVDRRAIAQEVVGQEPRRMATDATVLTIEQEKAGGKARLGFQGMCERLPSDDRHPFWEIHHGLARE